MLTQHPTNAKRTSRLIKRRNERLAAARRQMEAEIDHRSSRLEAARRQDHYGPGGDFWRTAR